MERKEQEHVSKWTGQEYTQQQQHGVQSEKLDNEYTKRGFLMKVPQSCLTLCNLMDRSLPRSSVHGILQAKNTGEGSRSLLHRIS